MLIRQGPPRSSCKDHWVEIRNQAGKVCFAQWEAAGPKCNDDAAYVFGTKRPRYQPSFDVSPAVAKYLGFTTSAKLSWRFVDDADVQEGRWLDPPLIAR